MNYKPIPFNDAPNDGSRRTSPHDVALPIRETFPEHDGETVRFEFDMGADGKGICTIIVLREGQEVDRCWFHAEHFAHLKRLRKALQASWRENIIKSDAVLNFYGGMKPQ